MLGLHKVVWHRRFHLHLNEAEGLAVGLRASINRHQAIGIDTQPFMNHGKETPAFGLERDRAVSTIYLRQIAVGE
jgi:hypothetical protein